MSTLSDRIRAQREAWLEVSEGKRVKIRRPAELQLAALKNGIEVEHIADVVVDWEGWTEADFLGGALGKSDPLPFDADAWREYVMDHGEIAAKIAQQFVDLVSKHFEVKADTAKN
jgi:hypothetical protein